MINGNTRDFINELYYEDHYVLYNGECFFFNGCQTCFKPDGKINHVTFEIYNLTKGTTVYSVEMQSAKQCIDEFENARIWNGMSFWDVEEKMEWTDI